MTPRDTHAGEDAGAMAPLTGEVIEGGNAYQGEAGHELAILDQQPGLRQAFLSQLAEVPEAGGYAVARIVATILSAATVDELDDPWDAQALEDYCDRPITVRAIRRLPSEFDKGLEWFVVIDGEDALDGRKLTLTTGSVSVVAQLIRLHTLDALPRTVIPRLSKRPSRAGYRPMHLEFANGRGQV